MKKLAIGASLAIGLGACTAQKPETLTADYIMSVDCVDSPDQPDLLGLEELGSVLDVPLYQLEITDGSDSEVLEVYVSLGGVILDGIELTPEHAGKVLVELENAVLVGGLPTIPPGNYEAGDTSASLVCQQPV